MPPKKHLLFDPEEDNDDAGKADDVGTVLPVADFKPTGGDVDDAERLRQDLAQLPDAQDPSTISSSPLAIAEAMLRGMVRRDGTQWKAGEALLSQDGMKEAMVPVSRAQGVGLGAPASTVLPGRRGAARGELLVAASDGDKVRSHVSVNEKLVKQRRVEKGEYVVLIGGPHRGAHAVVVECPQPLREADRVKVRLCLGGTDVAARSTYVRLRLERDMEPEAKRARVQAPPVGSSSAPPLKWCLWPGMVVRYIDQGRAGGRHYNVKMQVLDVSSPQTVTLLAPGGEIVDSVIESQVETVIPKAVGSAVMIVKGKKVGKRGNMVARDKGAQEVSVTLDDSLTKQYRIGFDAICALADSA